MSATPNDITEDRLLLLQLRDGSHLAFTALYELYSKTIYRKIKRMVGDEDTAKELLQEVFLKVWDKRENLDPAKSFRSYLFRIAVNLVYDFFRKAAREKELTEKLVVWMAGEESQEDEELASHHQKLLVNEIVGLLSPQRKQVFLLCKMEGKSYEEVGLALNISPSTVRDHMVKANKVIEKYIGDRPGMAVYSLLTLVFFHLK